MYALERYADAAEALRAYLDADPLAADCAEVRLDNVLTNAINFSERNPGRLVNSVRTQTLLQTPAVLHSHCRRLHLSSSHQGSTHQAVLRTQLHRRCETLPQNLSCAGAAGGVDAHPGAAAGAGGYA